ncbi:MAG TPA: DUF5700 domain-containing putative Zn-dependent protease [Blastocatellia bacterium]|nr:DUF5700 domain-containing putative Zn-dependent protease [Blastocatellia bacterium]
MFNRRGVLFAILFCSIIVPTSGSVAQTGGVQAVDVRIVADEAEAALAILSKRKAGQEVTEQDWQRLFSTEGYTRLKKRELALDRSFEEADFRTFMLSDALASRAAALEETLEKWRRADVSAAAGRALLYLPKGARIRAKIYPVIKPMENSFVFEVKTDPAIFLYLDPKMSREQFENTLAHELHHIGYGGSCPPAEAEQEIAALSANARTVVRWLGAFGEGLAMLAAAGGPGVHPHASSNAEDRARWDRDLSNFNQDFRKVEKFFLDVLENRMSEEESTKAGFSFFGVQGPWYTVGWKMAAVIEQGHGREKLIECICDQRRLLPVYNEAVRKHNSSSKEPLALWSDAIIDAISRPAARKQPAR